MNTIDFTSKHGAIAALWTFRDELNTLKACRWPIFAGEALHNVRPPETYSQARERNMHGLFLGELSIFLRKWEKADPEHKLFRVAGMRSRPEGDRT